MDTPVASQYLSAIVPAVNSGTLAHCCYHIEFKGPAGYNGLNILASDPSNGKNNELVFRK